MARLAAGLLLAAAAVALLSACGGEPSDPFVGMAMRDNFYAREVTRVDVGDAVRFSNDGDDLHNAVAVGGQWSTGAASGQAADALMSPGDEVRITFEEPGVYEFYCTLHGTEDGQGMAAVLVVGDAAYDPGEEDPVEPVTAWTGVTRRVGGPDGDFATVQEGVDAAAPGDLVLVAAGIYPEQVQVTTPYITIRGSDRDEVVIDGEGERANGIDIFADGVAVENLTVRGARQNGLFWQSVDGYRASYVTALDNGVYGIYAFDVTDGLFEHSYASGSPDAGFYIGQCDPCDAVIRDVVAEHNGLGYSGTNASGPLQIVDSVWRHNRAGIVPNSLDSELLPPVHDVTIVGNLVHDNDNDRAPTLEFQRVAQGNGIVLAGARDSIVARNRIVNHGVAGVVVAPLFDVNFWMSGGNEIVDNVIAGSGHADVVVGGPTLAGGCVDGNEVRRTLPPGLQTFQPCGEGLSLPFRWDLATFMQLAGRFAQAAGTDYPLSMGTAPPPPPQPDLPADAPVRPAVDVFDDARIDATAIEVPDAAGVEVTQHKELSMFGIPLAAGFWPVFFGLYGYLLPVVLLAVWIGLAIWDLIRRDDLSRGATVGWVAAVLLVPFLGPVLYYVLGRSPIAAWQRATFVGGGAAAYLVILAVGAVVGGIV